MPDSLAVTARFIRNVRLQLHGARPLRPALLFYRHGSPAVWSSTTPYVELAAVVQFRHDPTGKSVFMCAYYATGVIPTTAKRTRVTAP